MYSQIFFSINVGNSIKCEKNITPPPPPPPTFEIQNQNEGIQDIMDIDSNYPHLLFGETTSHLTSKWRGTFQYFFCNVENSIKREMRKNCFSKKKSAPPPHGIFFFHQFFFFLMLHTPMTWCTYLQSFEKIHQCVFELVRKLNVTDRRTGGVAISPVPGLRRRGR